eukprot:4230600-Alexandrium_andersonii.AAC.1
MIGNSSWPPSPNAPAARGPNQAPPLPSCCRQQGQFSNSLALCGGPPASVLKCAPQPAAAMSQG